MYSVQVPRTGISADELADVLRHELGPACQVKTTAPDQIKISKGPFRRARVTLSPEPGGTTFEVKGEAIRLPIPLFYAITRERNDRGIAARSADIISQSTRLRQDH